METMTLIEIAAVILGLLSVYLTTKENMWCWPTGIAMVILYVFIFANAKLYSDMIENLIYIVMQIYGWYYWVYGSKKKGDVPVKKLSNTKRIMWAATIIIGTISAGYYMDNYTDADFAYSDALTTVMSLVAQWLLGKKIIENWVLWISVDVISSTIYLLKGLYLTFGLYVLFFGLAIKGLIEWKNSMDKKKKEEMKGNLNIQGAY